MIKTEDWIIADHTVQCNHRFLELIAYLYNWPLCCKNCYGAGLFHFTGQLEIKNPVMIADCDSCYTRGICPRCAAPRLKINKDESRQRQEVIARDCTFCDWSKTDMALSMKAAPIYRCTCLAGGSIKVEKFIEPEPNEIEEKTAALESMINSWRKKAGTYSEDWHIFKPVFKITNIENPKVKPEETPKEKAARKKRNAELNLQLTLDM